MYNNIYKKVFIYRLTLPEKYSIIKRESLNAYTEYVFWNFNQNV